MESLDLVMPARTVKKKIGECAWTVFSIREKFFLLLLSFMCTISLGNSG